MTDVTRDFDAMLAERGRQRQTFRVGGQDFTIKAKLPHRKLQTLLAAMGKVDEDDAEAQRRAEEDFFRVCLIKADVDRFLALLNAEGDGDEVDEYAVIDAAQLGPITEWLLEHFMGKPSQTSDSSSDGASGTGQPRNVVSLNARAAS
jgi:hypothetical protein